MAVGQRRHQVAPLVPVLRPAVQAEDDVVAGPRFGDVEVEAARPTQRWVTPSTSGGWLTPDSYEARTATGCAPGRAGRPPPVRQCSAAAAPGGTRRASAHRLDVAGDHFRPRLVRMLVERLQAVAADHRDDGLVAGRSCPRAASRAVAGDRGAAGRLGEDALGRAEQVDRLEDLLVGGGRRRAAAASAPRRPPGRRRRARRSPASGPPSPASAARSRRRRGSRSRSASSRSPGRC